MSATRAIRVTVNGTIHEVSVEPRMLLTDFLRHELFLGGVHVGCEHGVCGICTILMDGKAVRACLTLAVQADGHESSLSASTWSFIRAISGDTMTAQPFISIAGA